MSSDGSPWHTADGELLGQIFQRLLPRLREEKRSVRLAVTRPFGRSYGEGALRVIRVKGDSESLQLLLAYERYHSGFEQQKRGNGKRRG